jgi:hypothetical protein
MSSMPRDLVLPPYAAPAPRSIGAFDRRSTMAATGAAMAAAVVYGCSPAAVWATLALAGLLWWATKEMPPRERRWFLGLAIAALALRYAATAVLPLLALRSGHSFAAWFGDGYYNVQRSIWLRNILVGVPIAPLDYFEAFQPTFGRTSYQSLLAFVHVLLGPSPYGAQLVGIALHAIGVVLLHRLVRRSYGPSAAMLCAAAVWYFPTLFLWSLSAMKEPEGFALSVLALVATVGIVRGDGWRVRLASAMCIGVAFAGLAGFRAGAVAIVFGGLAIGLFLRIVTSRSWALLATILLVPCGLWLAGRAGLTARARDEVRTFARHHLGHILTPGESYRVLDERFYYYDDPLEVTLVHPHTVATMTRAEMGRYLIRASAAFFLEPELWRPLAANVRWFIPIQVVWYVALLMAVPGLAVAWRRDPLVTCLIVGCIAGCVAVVAPNSGNIATLIRHRDMMSPFLFVLAAVGATAVMQKAVRGGATWR